jgi:cytochrome c
MEGFNYSAGMKAKQGPWNFDELNQWLYKPSAYVPGTRMAFAGISNDKERASVIAYLRSLSHSPVPLPAASPAAAAPAPAAQGPQSTQPPANQAQPQAEQNLSQQPPQAKPAGPLTTTPPPSPDAQNH